MRKKKQSKKWGRTGIYVVSFSILKKISFYSDIGYCYSSSVDERPHSTYNYCRVIDIRLEFLSTFIGSTQVQAVLIRLVAEQFRLLLDKSNVTNWTYFSSL